MEEEELRKQRYRYLLYQISNIYNNIESLKSDINSLNGYLSENFVVDDKMLCQDDLFFVLDSIKSISNELRTVVIPSARYKSY